MKKTVISIVLFLVACSEPYPGFREIENGCFFKWNELGTETHSLEDADFILLAYDYCKNSDCDSASYGRQIVLGTSGAHFRKKFWKDLHIGDRFTLVFDSDESGFKKSFSVPDSVAVKYPVVLSCEPMAMYGLNSYTGDSAYFEMLMESREKSLIDLWLTDEGGYALNKNGVYVKISEIGDGDSVYTGREVVMSYKAYFYDGRLFDNTDEWTDTFTYVVGVPNQVIWGITAGIDGLREGGKAKIIIPSRFAFGKTGSSTGLVPPYEPLKYEINIIDVNIN